MRINGLKLVIGGVAIVMVGSLFFVVPAVAAETNVCSNLENAWTARETAYSRAKSIRSDAFSKTYARWISLCDRLDAKGISTTTVRADAEAASSAFNNLLAADDAVIAAMKKYATAACAKSGVDQARRDIKTAQEGRKTARQTYAKSLRTLATDLAKLRTNKK